MEVVASLSQGRTAAAQCSLFTKKSVPVIFEPPCTTTPRNFVGRLPPVSTKAPKTSLVSCTEIRFTGRSALFNFCILLVLLVN